MTLAQRERETERGRDDRKEIRTIFVFLVGCCEKLEACVSSTFSCFHLRCVSPRISSPSARRVCKKLQRGSTGTLTTGPQPASNRGELAWAPVVDPVGARLGLPIGPAKSFNAGPPSGTPVKGFCRLDWDSQSGLQNPLTGSSDRRLDSGVSSGPIGTPNRACKIL